MKCPFCEETDMSLEGLCAHLAANHQKRVAFPIYAKVGADGSIELFEGGYGACNLIPILDDNTRCPVLSPTYGLRCTYLKEHDGPHFHFPYNSEYFMVISFCGGQP